MPQVRPNPRLGLVCFSTLPTPLGLYRFYHPKIKFAFKQRSDSAVVFFLLCNVHIIAETTRTLFHYLRYVVANSLGFVSLVGHNKFFLKAST